MSPFKGENQMSTFFSVTAPNVLHGFLMNDAYKHIGDVGQCPARLLRYTRYRIIEYFQGRYHYGMYGPGS